MPGWVNVQVPLQFVPNLVADVATGTPLLHVGVDGPRTHCTPCGISLGLRIVTAPPATTETAEGDQA